MNFDIAIQAHKITKKFENGKFGLHESTFEIPSGSLVAVLGPSGCGKSTLLKALNGDSPISSGQVWLNGLELNEKNYEYLKTHIGYVPQDDIVHKELTVEQSLKYAARLRLTSHTSKEINKKVDEVLITLGIEEIRKSKVGSISGGQRKRVSIAMEILTDPLILFLDEPTSPLDPQSIENFLLTLRKLADNGTTVIMVTHKPEDLSYMDKAIFMAEGGHFAYYGDTESYLDYFQVKNVVKVYSKLVGDNAKYWIEKYKAENPSELNIKSTNTINTTVVPTNYSQQYFWLTLRYFNIKLNDRVNFLILISQAPIIAILICAIFDSISQVVPFFLAISAIWFGTNNAAREIVSEKSIFKRERMFNQGIFTYIFSKLTVLGVIATIQSAIFTWIIWYYFGDETPSWHNPKMTFIWMTSLTVSATLMGLLLSALVSSTDKVMSIIPLALIPQIMLAGIIVKINNVFVELLSYLTLSRWGTVGFAKIQEDIAVPKPVIKSGTGILQDGKFIQPIPEISSTQDSTVNAVKEISKNFLESSLGRFEIYNDSILLEFFALGLLSLVFFIAIFLALKDKDSIAIHD